MQQWQAEGIIDGETYLQLVNRYGLNQLDTASRDRFVMVLLGLGSTLLGLAVITIVAANWQSWARWLQVLLLVGLFVGVNSFGFYLWRSSRRGWQTRLGQALLLLGALILGANLGLMSQMFHLSGAVYQLYLVWSLGVVAMAWSLRLTLLGILALILMAIAYSLGIPLTFDQGQFSLYEVAIEHMPLLAGVLFVPLAYRCVSPWLFGLTVGLVVVALETGMLSLVFQFGTSNILAGMVGAVAFALPCALLWAYQDSMWGLDWSYFDALARSLGVFFLATGLYLFSFHYFWTDYDSPTENTALTALPILIDVVALSAVAAWGWWRLGYNRNKTWRIDLDSTLIGATILVAASLFWWRLSFVTSETELIFGIIATVVFNALITILAIALLKKAISNGSRFSFWGGVVLLVLQIMSRMLEYNTGLLFKAVVLFACGIAIIFAGLWFERHMREVSSE